MIRKANRGDISAVVDIYHQILDKEAAGECCTGWIRGVYPTESTALQALMREELFVEVIENQVVAAARINGEQGPEYAECPWTFQAPDNEIMVLHTLVVSPSASGRGHGREFVHFYEEYAQKQGCTCLRMDTNKINTPARRLYKSLGYREAGIVPCCFHGIPNVQLICLEKKLS